MMTRDEFISRARESGLLEPGLRLGIISTTQVMRSEVERFYRSLRSNGERYVDAIHETSIKFRISYSYVTQIVSGL